MTDKYRKAEFKKLSPLEWLSLFGNQLRYELNGEWPAHIDYNNQIVKELLKRPLGKPEQPQNAYDRAKNYAGGYDWGYRVGNEGNAELMARAYQQMQNRPDAAQDYIQNLAGIMAGVQDNKKGKRLSLEELLQEAERYGIQIND